jgi:transcriptional regulator with XRE-family HTH domain
MDSVALGAFLRHRRSALQPEDVGMPRGRRRRTDGLRREEIAALVGMSPDYFARLERGAGPQPSVQMVAALARGLRLSVSERDHLFALAGHQAPGRHTSHGAHVGPGLMRILDRLSDTPAQVMGGLGETLVQTPIAVALFGDETGFVGPDRSVVHRWFTDPGSRSIYLADDHDTHGRVFAAQLRNAVARRGPDSDAAALARHLGTVSPEFADVWAAQEIGVRHDGPKRFVHPEVGRLDLDCQTLLDPDTDHALLVFTATPGTPSYDTLALLAVLGRTTLNSS